MNFGLVYSNFNKVDSILLKLALTNTKKVIVTISFKNKTYQSVCGFSYDIDKKHYKISTEYRGFFSNDTQMYLYLSRCDKKESCDCKNINEVIVSFIDKNHPIEQFKKRILLIANK